MIAPTQIQKPANWQDFEKLCKKLWGEIWGCSDTIQRNGRNGQNQHGVDIYGVPKNETAYYGIQCKGKDEYAHSQLTEDEIDGEIAKAKTFEPPLKRLIFATTANKDAAIESYVRKKNIENIACGSFEIYLSSWEDIVDLLEERRDTYNWYINNCHYKDSTDVVVSIEGETEYTIHPQYFRTTKKYEYSPPSRLSMQIPSFNFSPIMVGGPRKVDYRWAKFYVRVENVGSTTIEDYKLYLSFDENGIAQTSDLIHYPNSFGMSETARTAIWERIDKNREVYEYSDCNDLDIVPTEKTLVQTDSRSFRIGIKPQDDATEIIMHWDFKSRDYNKQGTIIIKVEPIFEDREQVIKVDSYSLCKEDEIIIEPKIVEQE